MSLRPPDLIEVAEPADAACHRELLSPEGNVKQRNYRVINDTLRAYTPTGDIHTSPTKGKLVSRFDVGSSVSPPRDRILELLRPEDPGRDALEAIVRPAPRRGLLRPLDDDTRRFLQRALMSPSPQGLSAAATPEPPTIPEIVVESQDDTQNCSSERSLAEELREAEEEERAGSGVRVVRESSEWQWRDGPESSLEAAERERLGRLALAVEEDEASAEGGDGGEGLSVAARRLDALLAESRALHAELAAIHRDLQMSWARATRCAAGTRALRAEACSVRYLDDVLALLRGDEAAAGRRDWPFALRPRRPDRNYVV